MKQLKNFSLIGLGIFLLSTTQCSSGERSVSINSVRPADIDVPADIQTLLIVDRTKYDKPVVDVLESVLTGELPQEDKASMQYLTNAMRAELSSSPRFEIKLATERLSGNSLTSAFPEALPWTKIQSLCDKYSADAVIAVEIFDTDFIVTNGVRRKKVTEGGVSRDVDEYYAQGINNLKMGLRLYNPASQQILDQKVINKRGTWNAAAASKVLAIAALIDKADATHQLSSQVGADYAYRVSPMSVMLTRRFRGKSRKTPELEQGSRMADVGNWKDAIVVWESGLNTKEAKDAGYLSYNIAVAYEILGDMAMAKKWASDSYTKYGNNDAKFYLNLLNTRIQNERIAELQIQEKVD
ncbi:MAG: hypothetical protein HKP14_01380 [Bacteroidia bacterium]|nr:hypothetical protein [Bacteroidia bacterium]